jgi:hypothetical protein
MAPLGLALIALLSIPPLLLEARPIDWISTPAVPLARTLVAVVIVATLALRAWVDRAREPGIVLQTLGFVLLAGAMTAWHVHRVDRPNEAWQRQLYLDILDHTGDEAGPLRVPHQFRPLPYGFVRSLERLTGDWCFACVAYRWFFTFWFLWAAYRFASIYVPRRTALITLVPLVVLYPLSIEYYWGQLTDPLSHTLFALALIYLVRDEAWLLAAALFLGVLAKETVVLVTLSYLACHWRGGWRAVARTAALGMACVAAYLAVRLPLGWTPGYAAINGTEGSMLGTNLGIGPPLYRGAAPSVMNYLHPLLFIGVFLPSLIWRWRHLDPCLRLVGVTLVPLLLWSNLNFGWMYESRNYMPLVPLLATMCGQALETPTGTRPRKNGT